MAASPEAQAPMNQDNSEIVPVGAPHIDQSKYRETHMSDVVDELTVPDAPTQELHQPAHFRENIDGFTDQGSRFTKGQKWMAIGAGILTLGAGVLLGKASSNSEPSSQSVGSDVPSTSAPAVLGQEGVSNTELPPLDMYSVDITHEDYGRQLDVTLPYLQERRPKSLEEVKAELKLQNRVPLDDPTKYPEGSMMRKAIEDQIRITSDLWTISNEANEVLARNLLNSVFLNNSILANDAYDKNEELIGNGKGRILEYTKVNEVGGVFTNGTLGTTQLSGNESYMALLTSWTQPVSYEQVLSHYTSENGAYSTTVVVESIQWGGEGFVEHPSDVHPAGS